MLPSEALREELMGEADTRQAEERIDTAEKRLVALHDLGIDTAALRSQLAFARTRLSEGETSGIVALCDDVMAAARRLADGAGSGGPAKVRTDRYTRDQLGDAIRTQLSQGLFAKLLAEHQSGSDPRLEARLQALESGVASRLSAAETALAEARSSAQQDVAALRAEVQRSLDLISQARQSAATPSGDGSGTAQALERFAVQAAEQQERLLTTLAGGLERVGAALAQQPVYSPASAPAPAAASASVHQDLQDGLTRIAEAIRERPVTPASAPTAVPASVASHAPLIDSQSLDASDMTSLVLERFAGHAAEQQERLLVALSSGLEHLGAVLGTRVAATSAEPSALMQETLRDGFAHLAEAIGQRPAPGAPAAESASPGAAAAASTSDSATGAIYEQLAAQAAAHQERLIATLTSGMEKLCEALANRGGAHVLAHVDPSSGVSAALTEGFERLLQEMASRRNPVIEPSPRVDGGMGEGGKFEHETTRVFQSVSTRTDKPAVTAPAEPPEPTIVQPQESRILDTGRVRRLVADEVGQQITDRQSGAEPITIYDPEQVRVQVVNEVNRMLADRFDPHAGAAVKESVKEAEVSRLMASLLPSLLTDEPVRRALFSMIALEAVSNPGALGELTGLRAFLRHELALAAEELTHNAQPA